MNIKTSHQKIRTFFQYLSIIICLLAAPPIAHAIDDGILIYGNVGQTYWFEQEETSAGGYGQVGWAMKSGIHQLGLTITSKRLRNIKREMAGELMFYSLELESVSIEEELTAGPMTFNIGAEIGRITSQHVEEIHRDSMHGGVIGVGISFFENNYIRLHGKFGAFLVRPDREWRQRFRLKELKGGFFCVGVDLAEPEKDF